MIIQPIAELAKYEGVPVESQNFKFDEANAAHFFSLIANLYSDPVVAVLREIGANAVDAHGMNGNSEPWELHLPGRLDSTIRFVDHGVGMSHETVMNLYSTVGASTKRNNSSQIGGFGCGRISLFALVNNFQVISTFDGLRSTYFLCQQSNGLPDIKVLSQVETTDSNGVEIKFTCPERYVGEFKEKFRSAYTFFTIKPSIFIGDEQTIIKDWYNKTPIFESEDKSYHLTGKHEASFIVMGGVAYRLPVEMIVQESKFAKWESLLSHGLVVFANIGDYSITPSREAIKFDHITSARLIAKLEEILASILPKLQTEMDAFVGNSRDAKLEYKRIKKDLGFLPAFSLNWNGEPITGEPWKLSKDSGVTYVARRSYTKTCDVQFDITYVESSKSSSIIVDDLKRGGVSRVKYKVKQTDRYVDGNNYYIIPADKLDNFIKETNWIGNDWTYTSSLEKVPCNRTYTKVDKNAFRTLAKRPYINRVSQQLEPIDEAKMNDATSIIIFPTESYTVFGYEPNNIKEIIVWLESGDFDGIGNSIYPIFCNKNKYDAIIDDSEGIKIHDILAMQDVKDAISKVVNSVSSTKIGMNYKLNANIDNFVTAPLSADNSVFILKKWAKKTITNNVLDNSVQNIISAVDKNLLVPDEKHFADIKAEYDLMLEEVKNKYPLVLNALEIIDIYYEAINKIGLVQYIQQMDELKALKEAQAEIGI